VDPSLIGSFQLANTLWASEVQFSLSSITELPYPDKHFDAVICISVLEHMGSAKLRVIRELARVLTPGGRLVLTCDLSLARDCDTILEDLSVVLGDLQEHFELTYPLDLHRGPDLLTTDYFQRVEPWRLPWRRAPLSIKNLISGRVGKRYFRSIAVLGLTADRRATASPA
jgi:SAM-dependent methyltransferase